MSFVQGFPCMLEVMSF